MTHQVTTRLQPTYLPTPDPHVCARNSGPLVTCICTQELNVFRGKCGMLFHYDWISVPLVYTQVTL